MSKSKEEQRINDFICNAGLSSSPIDVYDIQFKGSRVIELLSLYAQQEAIEFAQYCSKKNIYPNEYSYNQFQQQKTINK